jgi:hypothetical protein
MSKRFTIIVPEALWPLACQIVAARGEIGRGMLCVHLIKASDRSIFYASPAGGSLDDPETYSRFRDPWGLFDYLQSINETTLSFTADDVIDVFLEAIIIEHQDGEIVTDAVFTGIGFEIVGIVNVFPESA